MDEKITIQRTTNGWILVAPSPAWDDEGKGVILTYSFEDNEDGADSSASMAISLHRLLWEAFSDHFQSKRFGGLKMDVRDKGWAEGDDKSLLGLDDEDVKPVILTDNVKIS